MRALVASVRSVLAAGLLLVAAGAAAAQTAATSLPESPPRTAELAGAAPVAIVGATLITVTRGVVPNGTLIVRDGKIAEIGVGLQIPQEARVIDASGRFVMPGMIDTHSHMGIYPWPDTGAHEDGNEMTDPITPHLRAEDGVHLEDPAFARARAGGVTTVQVLPGSANLQGGQSLVLKLRDANTLEEMKLQGAPRGIKMAFGENPKRIYGSKQRSPSTRMGNAAVLRRSFLDAREYERQWTDYDKNLEARTPTRRPVKQPEMETLLDVLNGKVLVHFHCYRKDDLLTLLRISEEFGFRIASIQHGLECYKIAPELARRGIAVCTWPDWWGFKMEAYDAIPQNASILVDAGVKVAIHSDSSDTVQRFFHEAAKTVRYGMKRVDALKAITIWPAEILGIAERVGSIEVGKDADLVVLTHHPFDVYTRVAITLIDGRVAFDAAEADGEAVR